MADRDEVPDGTAAVEPTVGPLGIDLTRRSLLKTTGFAVAGAAGVTQTAGQATAAGGDLIWAFRTGSQIVSSPTVVDGTVYVGIEANLVYAIDAATGAGEWFFETGGPVRSSPTVVDGTVYVGSLDNHVYAIDAATGTGVWAFETGGQVFSSPTVVDGTVFVGSGDSHVYALDAGADGSSDDSRVNLGTLGHHHGWTGQAPSTDPTPTSTP